VRPRTHGVPREILLPPSPPVSPARPSRRSATSLSRPKATCSGRELALRASSQRARNEPFPRLPTGVTPAGAHGGFFSARSSCRSHGLTQTPDSRGSRNRDQDVGCSLGSGLGWRHSPAIILFSAQRAGATPDEQIRLQQGSPRKTLSRRTFEGRAWQIEKKGEQKKGYLAAGRVTHRRKIRARSRSHVYEPVSPYTLTAMFVDDGECACLKRCFLRSGASSSSSSSKAFRPETGLHRCPRPRLPERGTAPASRR